MVTIYRTAGYRLAATLLALTLAFGARSDDVSEALRRDIELLATEDGLSLAGDAVASGPLLTEFYERRQFEPAWQRPEQVEELASAIMATEADGLNPEDYHLAAVTTALQALRGGEPLSPAERASMDILFTESLVRLGYHQRFGKVNPYTLDPEWNFRRDLDGIDAATAIQDTIDAPSLGEHLRSLFPRDAFYRRLQASLERYRQISAAGGWPAVPEGATLRPGDSSDRVPYLRQRLAVSGDLDLDGTLAGDEFFDADLEAAVRRFQSRHGLEADGVVGTATLRALNVTAQSRVRQLEVNLERARWVLDDGTRDFVLVNIAAFRAYVVRDGEIVWQTRVQVGSPYHKTPVFRDLMRYVVLNPTWTVPYSIATREMLPAVRNDPAYLATRNFEVRDASGTPVDPATVDWSGLSRRNFPFQFVQRPGPDNALGRIKFMFPNAQDIYLHDTPRTELFQKSTRAFSHGCIRVDQPLELAETLLFADGWDKDRLRAAIAGGKTQTVFLSKPIPVLLLYWTAEVDPDDVVHFYADIYDRDEAIAAGLDEPFRLDPPSR